jgi:hypothetical protein
MFFCHSSRSNRMKAAAREGGGVYLGEGYFALSGPVLRAAACRRRDKAGICGEETTCNEISGRRILRRRSRRAHFAIFLIAVNARPIWAKAGKT